MELSWSVTAILGIAIIFIIFWILNKKNDYWEKRGVPSVKSTPVIGLMKDVLLGKRGMGEIFTDVYKDFENEKFCGYIQFLKPSIMIRDPELINRVLIKDFTHFEDRGPAFKYATDLFSLSLSNLTGDQWRNVRHSITPTFTSGKLKNMFPWIKECSYEVVDYLKEKDCEAFEIREFMLKFVINVIGSTAFGLKINTLNENDETSKQFFKMASRFFKPSKTFILKMTVVMSMQNLNRFLKFKLLDDEVEIFFRNLTKDVIKLRETTDAKRNDFINLLLQLKKKEKESLTNGIINSSNKIDSFKNETFEDEDQELLDQLKNTPKGTSGSNREIFTDGFIAAQTFLFIAGGSETTAAMLSFIFYELSVNQELQTKVHDEVRDVLSTEDFNYQAIKKMTYMEQFINETLRLHPIAGILMRICTNDYKIPGTEIVIEKGTLVNVPVLGLHKDPQYFPDPEKFNPDRFESMDDVPKNVYFPFGGGPRICIALRLAMLEMKVIVASILLNYKVILSEKTKLPIKIKKSSFLQHVDGGIWVKFQKRSA